VDNEISFIFYFWHFYFIFIFELFLFLIVFIVYRDSMMSGRQPLRTMKSTVKPLSF